MIVNILTQPEIIEGTVLTVGYVGSRGVHLFSQHDLNPNKNPDHRHEWGVSFHGCFDTGHKCPQECGHGRLDHRYPDMLNLSWIRLPMDLRQWSSLRHIHT